MTLTVELYRPPVAEDPSVYWDRLSELAAILDGLPWALAGGLAVPVTTGSFYRRHYDVDIIFPWAAMPEIEAAMRRARFELRTHFPFSFFKMLRGALHVSVSSTGALVRRRMRKLKFRDTSGRRHLPFAIVEAFPYWIEDGMMISCDGHQRVPLTKPLIGYRHVTPGGPEIPCHDLDYVAACMRGRREPKHARDLSVIAEHLRLPLPSAPRLKHPPPAPSPRTGRGAVRCPVQHALPGV